MALRTILEYPDPRLRTQAAPMAPADFTPELSQLIDDMFETMYSAPGIGLAATQVDFHKQLIVIDVSKERTEPLVFINPEILSASEDQATLEEGCLSVPGFYESVIRSERIRVRALDRDGQPLELDADGLLAVCIQHEMDHLVGRVFVDYLSPMKRARLAAKFRKKQRLAG